MIDSLRNTYLPYTTLVPPSCTPEPPFFHKYVEDVHVHVHARTHIPISSTHMYERVHACTRTPGTMYGFVARTSNCCAREHQAEGVNVYDKCEIPFRDDYVLLSFGWVTTNPLLPSTHSPPLYLSPFFFLAIPRCPSEKKGSGIVGLRHLVVPSTTLLRSSRIPPVNSIDFFPGTRRGILSDPAILTKNISARCRKYQPDIRSPSDRL